MESREDPRGALVACAGELSLPTWGRPVKGPQGSSLGQRDGEPQGRPTRACVGAGGGRARPPSSRALSPALNRWEALGVPAAQRSGWSWWHLAASFLTSQRDRKCSAAGLGGGNEAQTNSGLGPVLPGATAGAPARGHAPTAVTNFKVCSVSVCLSYELVHLYLLL